MGYQLILRISMMEYRLALACFDNIPHWFPNVLAGFPIALVRFLTDFPLVLKRVWSDFPFVLE